MCIVCKCIINMNIKPVKVSFFIAMFELMTGGSDSIDLAASNCVNSILVRTTVTREHNISTNVLLMYSKDGVKVHKQCYTVCEAIAMGYTCKGIARHRACTVLQFV